MTTKPPSGPTYRDELAISHHFVEVLEQRLAGRDQLRRANVHPLDWCLLGVLGPAKAEPAALELEVEQPEGQELANGGNAQPATAVSAKSAGGKAPATGDSTKEDEDVAAKPADKAEDSDATRRPPSALGFEILAEPDADGIVELVVDASFCLFTKHLPSWKEQTEVLGSGSGASEGLPVAEVVQRWPLAVEAIRFQLRATGERSQDDKGAVQGIVDEALQNAIGREDAGRKWHPRPKVDDAAYLKDEQAFGPFLASLRAMYPLEQWQILAKLEVRVWLRADGKLRIGCYLRNATPATGVGYQDAYRVIGDAAVKATITRGALRPVEILPVPQDYQFDRRVWAVGHNTSVRVSPDHQRLETHALAVHEQVRIVTRNVPPAKFLELAKDPLATLDRIYVAMGDYANDWQTRVVDGNALELDATELKECAKDLAGFRKEMDRFAAGAAALLANLKFSSN